MTDEDIFAGDVEGRLERLDRQVRAVVLDAQCRDWIAERPDRVGFARLGQVHHELRSAIRRYNPMRKAEDWVWPVLSTATWLVTTLVILLVADRPAAPLTLAFALVAGLIVAQAAISVTEQRKKKAAAAGIEDPALYADLTQRIEACAATARADPEQRAAAEDLGRALDWVSATRDEISRGSSPATR
ncbi:hypothetical protein [Paractinoplanes durhamensis]|uniref:SMODS and SLOG-associating 2TM effector domain-containing protein n=1 Tax=Paractinoplanes durhamensis TaxID=113563 RepID=A0ABQ3YY43_9ACTN|nr:hypothetical protein [Actinoplanes durhamensis]GIE02439.1 hypothetical protein Adu01nite_37890 [Actinoplanes durhamensis]